MALTPKNSAVDVYSVGEIAQAAGVPVARVEALVASGRVRSLAMSPGFFETQQAISAVRALRADGGRSAALLFDKPEFAHASAKVPIAAASALHAGIAATLILISTIGLPQAAETRVRLEPVQTRLVFIATPGPGGGGGGGGLRQKAPPPRAQRKGKSSLDSPVPVRKAPKPVEAAPKPEPPPPPPPVKPEPNVRVSSTSRHRRSQPRAADPALAAAWDRVMALALAKATDRASERERAAAWAADRIAPAAGCYRRGSCAK
jgi:hypothetical protein